MTSAEAMPPPAAAAVAQQGAHVAPKAACPKKGSSNKNGAPKAAPVGKKGRVAIKKPAKKARKAATKPAANKERLGRETSKKAIVIGLLNRKGGATMAEIAGVTGWQKHSIRGFISGTLMKRMELPVASLKNDQGERVYRIEK